MYQTAPNAAMGYGYPNYGFGMGMVPNQQQMPPATSWLTAEEQESLRKNGGGFSLGVTPEELQAAQCNHVFVNGDPATIKNADGTYTCQICGTKFRTVDFDKEEIQNIIDNTLDIMNTIKVMYMSAPVEQARTFFQTIAFLKKVPQLYEIASNDFRKYESVSNYNAAGNMNLYGMFNAITTPGWGMPNYGYGQPQPMGYPGQPPVNAQANPMYAQAAPQAPYMGQPQYQQPYMGQQPVAQPYNLAPQGAAASAPGYGYVNTNLPVQPGQAPAQQQAAPQQNGTSVGAPAPAGK